MAYHLAVIWYTMTLLQVRQLTFKQPVMRMLYFVRQTATADLCPCLRNRTNHHKRLHEQCSLSIIAPTLWQGFASAAHLRRHGKVMPLAL